MSYTLIYPDFIDTATGKTLVVTPGSAYTVAVASGRIAATPEHPNDGRWVAAPPPVEPSPPVAAPEKTENAKPEKPTSKKEGA